MTSRLFRSTLVVGVCTLVSRVLGFVRDLVIAHGFGASTGADAFFVAFRIPNLLRRMFAEGAFSQGFVPVLSEYRETREREEIRALVAHVAGTLAAVLTLVTLAGVLGAAYVVVLFAPGFLDDPQKHELATEMLRVTFPYILFISLTALAAGVQNTHGHFAVPAFTPILLNLSLIGSALWLAPHLGAPVTALAFGVLFAGIVQLSFQLPFLARLGLLVRPRIDRGHEGVRRVVRLMVPALFGASVSQLNLLVDTLIASFLVTGSISWLYYADRMVEFPLGVFGIALATVILPGLSARHAQGDAAGFCAALDWGLRLVILVSIPSAVGLGLLALPAIGTLFHHGAFGDRDATMAGLALAAFAAGLPAFMLVKILAPGFFARQDTRTPVRVGLVAMGANVVLNLSLVGYLGHVGLALATATAAYVNAGLLYRGLRRERAYRPASGWAAFAWRTLGATLVMAAVVGSFRGPDQWWLMAEPGARGLRLAGLVTGGALAFGLTLLALGMRPSMLREPAPSA